MSFETIGEVLRRVAQYHCKASDYYTTLNSSIADERSNMILRQLATQQREQAQHLQAYLKSAAASTLATELQFSPEKELWEAPDVVDAATTNVEDITRLMVGIDNTVLRLYSQLRNEQLPPRLEELFLRLEEQQEAIARMHSFDVLEAQDL